jgi:hypothetical protein
MNRFLHSGISTIAACIALLASELTYSAEPLPPHSLCVDNNCVASAVSTNDSDYVKWNPGHYMLLDGIASDAATRTRHFDQIAALANEPNIRGVKLMLYWGDLERSKGDYSSGFSIVDAYLAKLAPLKKRLILSVQDRAFGAYSPTSLTRYFPAYITTDPSYGVTPWSNGIIARVWVPATTDRLILLSKAMANRYDANPYFEMFQGEESAIAVTAGTDGYSIPAALSQMKRWITASDEVWKHTIVRVCANWIGSNEQAIDLINHAASNKTAIGGPDVIPHENIQANVVFNGKVGGVDHRGTIPWVSEIQAPELGGKDGNYTPKELYNHAMSEVGTQYFVWYRNTWAGGDAQKWDSGMLPFIRSINGASNTACPKSFGNKCKSN